ncbi:cytochrome c [Botrimarina hoheduenensis]|uniref:Cytochrome c n=1 Tax=Botrimarina hoheduenensis TaxID=2528000 RepID=A0A5C5VW12_9BACT|nr:c-type cytochrome [Botrimarina hoheduenensis]TWT42866.1 Cytochrome c [Botrimarina hoheduenensis]
MLGISRSAAGSIAWVAACLVGCGPATFQPNELLHSSQGLTAAQSEAIETVLLEIFGTPAEPRLPELLHATIDHNNLIRCAGEVISHEPGVTQGLYGRHCARCHGVTGDGQGPTALYQHPYPRDFRRGVFKWKSTYRDALPTISDLHTVLERGVPGAAMPSFRLLSTDERNALVDYVVYLTLRGQLERELVLLSVEELAEEELVTVATAEPLLASLSTAWTDTDRLVVNSSQPIQNLVDANLIAQGKELFHSELTGCAKCHGTNGAGLTPNVTASDRDYDLWDTERREILTASQTTDNPRLIAAAKRAFPPRPSWGRELTTVKRRGGDEPETLFRRLHQGIAGTTMPALGPLRPGQPAALSDPQIWALVAYVESLGISDEPSDEGSPHYAASAQEVP